MWHRGGEGGTFLLNTQMTLALADFGPQPDLCQICLIEALKLLKLGKDHKFEVTNAKLSVRRRNPELTAGRGFKSNRNHKRERSLTHHGHRFPSTQGKNSPALLSTRSSRLQALIRALDPGY